MAVRVHTDYLEKVRKKQKALYNTQSDLQTRAKVGKDAVSKFLRGISISRENFDKICDSLEFSEEEINEFREVVDNFQFSQADDKLDIINNTVAKKRG